LETDGRSGYHAKLFLSIDPKKFHVVCLCKPQRSHILANWICRMEAAQ